MKHWWYITVLISLFLSCSEMKNDDSSILDNMDKLISQNPDSAIAVLDSYEVSPKDLYNYNRYRLYLTKVKNKLDISINNDLEIINVYNYFNEIGNDYYSGLSAYYCGKVLQQNNAYDKALDYYNLAKSYAVKSGDINFQGLVVYAKGELMLDNLLNEDAKQKFIEAIKLFHQTGNYKEEIKNLSCLASTFVIESQYDSATYYYDKAYTLADEYNDNEERAYALKDMGLLLYDKGDFKQSVRLINEAKKIDSIIIKSGKADLILSSSYLGMNQTDSALYYFNSGLSWIDKDDSKYLKTKATAYLIGSTICEKMNNYQEALENYKLYKECLEEMIDKDQVDAIIDAERKYKLEVAEKEIDQISMKQIQTQRIVFGLLIIISIITIIYYRLIIKKNRQLSKANDDILKLTDFLNEFNETKDSVNDYYTHYFNILKRAASLEYEVQESGNKQGKSLIKRFNEIAYGQENIDWDRLYKLINNIHNKIFDKIKERFPELDETEFRICCLLCSKMNSNEIAIILKLRVITIRMKTTNIRKKLGIEKYGNLVDFLYQHVK